jgi:hypothetical protein
MKKLFAVFTLLSMLSGFVVPAFADTASGSSLGCCDCRPAAAPAAAAPAALLPHRNVVTRVLTATRAMLPG